MNIINQVLRRFHVILVPRPPTGKMLREDANIIETHHPAGAVRSANWLRHVADLIDESAPRGDA